MVNCVESFSKIEKNDSVDEALFDVTGPFVHSI